MGIIEVMVNYLYGEGFGRDQIIILISDLGYFKSQVREVIS